MYIKRDINCLSQIKKKKRNTERYTIRLGMFNKLYIYIIVVLKNIHGSQGGKGAPPRLKTHDLYIFPC